MNLDNHQREQEVFVNKCLLQSSAALKSRKKYVVQDELCLSSPSASSPFYSVNWGSGSRDTCFGSSVTNAWNQGACIWVGRTCCTVEKGCWVFFNMSSTFGATLGLFHISDIKLFSGCFLHVFYLPNEIVSSSFASMSTIIALKADFKWVVDT